MKESPLKEVPGAFMKESPLKKVPEAFMKEREDKSRSILQEKIETIIIEIEKLKVKKIQEINLRQADYGIKN
jgi:hypothetical protein